MFFSFFVWAVHGFFVVARVNGPCINTKGVAQIICIFKTNEKINIFIEFATKPKNYFFMKYCLLGLMTILMMILINFKDQIQDVKMGSKTYVLENDWIKRELAKNCKTFKCIQEKANMYNLLYSLILIVIFSH